MESVKIWVSNRAQKKRRRVTLRVASNRRDRKKTAVSTFVNFIHQKDAQIAMRVVERMLLNNYPIYTVHDNFITTIEYSKELPHIYSTVISEMGPPLKIINEFIYMNVIIPVLSPNDEYHESFCNSIITESKLFKYLMFNVPENLTMSQRATWLEKIDMIVKSYITYTNLVCDDEISWDSHIKRWNSFQECILNENYDKKGLHFEYYND